MTRDEALQLARSIIGPSAMMGYLLGRGDCWEPGDSFNAYRRVVAGVMDAAYYLLVPLWRQHIDLDPGKSHDPLSLNDAEAPADPVQPSDLLIYISNLEDQLVHVTRRLLADEQLGVDHEWIEEHATVFREALGNARDLFSGPSS